MPLNSLLTHVTTGLLLRALNMPVFKKDFPQLTFAWPPTLHRAIEMMIEGLI